MHFISVLLSLVQIYIYKLSKHAHIVICNTIMWTKTLTNSMSIIMILLVAAARTVFSATTTSEEEDTHSNNPSLLLHSRRLLQEGENHDSAYVIIGIICAMLAIVLGALVIACIRRSNS